ncbi:zinc-binding dehydrogenase [Pseudonocardia acaciae]|uniref:zinc-binding dehydrogenase n=1 Tax=Pseudonocardia acaciae TaxID=551276 RepID=UPI000490F191|nr:zinc-binding dehydrogenase [Pseudonocardia acaciae]
MKAHVLHSHGTVRDLRFERSWPDPTPHEGSVVIAVKACSLNYHDIFTMRGMPGIKVPMPIIMGIDMAGDVVAVGPGVTDFKPGDRVLVDPLDRRRNKLIGEMMDGGLAEYCEVGAHTLIPLPDQVSYADAAALPVAYGTAYRMMVTRGRVARDEKVLILGASGGVGTCCVQLARLAGAHVAVAASTDEKLARLKEMGADEGINYTTEKLTHAVHERYGKPRVWGDGGVDVVVNFTGGDTWVPTLRCLHNNGRVLTCGATAGYDPKTDLRFIWTFELNVIGSNGWNREDLHALLDLIGDGRLTPTIDSTFPLHRADEALTLLEQRGVVGKIIVAPGT